MIKPTCKGIKKDGNRCTSTSLVDGEYCWFHSPKYAEDRARASSKGGLRTRYKKMDSTEDVEDLEERVVEGLKNVVTAVENMQASPEQARVLIAALTSLDKALESREAKRSNTVKIEVEYINDWRRAPRETSMASPGAEARQIRVEAL